MPDVVQLAPELDQIRKAVCAAYGVDESNLLTSQRGKSNEPRNVAIYLGRILRKDSLLVLGEAFGMTGYNPAGSSIARVRKKMIEDKKFQKWLTAISHSILTEIGQNETWPLSTKRRK